MDSFARRMKTVISAGKLIGIPAAVLAGWITAAALVVSELAAPVPLEGAVEKVLAASEAQQAPEGLPAAPPPVAAQSEPSGNAG